MNEDRRMERLLTQTKHTSGNLWHRNFVILFPTISETDIIKSHDYHIWWTCAVTDSRNSYSTNCVPLLADWFLYLANRRRGEATCCLMTTTDTSLSSFVEPFE